MSNRAVATTAALISAATASGPLASGAFTPALSAVESLTLQQSQCSFAIQDICQESEDAFFDDSVCECLVKFPFDEDAIPEGSDWETYWADLKAQYQLFFYLNLASFFAGIGTAYYTVYDFFFGAGGAWDVGTIAALIGSGLIISYTWNRMWMYAANWILGFIPFLRGIFSWFKYQTLNLVWFGMAAVWGGVIASLALGTGVFNGFTAMLATTLLAAAWTAMIILFRADVMAYLAIEKVMFDNKSFDWDNVEPSDINEQGYLVITEENYWYLSNDYHRSFAGL